MNDECFPFPENSPTFPIWVYRALYDQQTDRWTWTGSVDTDSLACTFCNSAYQFRCCGKRQKCCENHWTKPCAAMATEKTRRQSGLQIAFAFLNPNVWKFIYKSIRRLSLKRDGYRCTIFLHQLILSFEPLPLPYHDWFQQFSNNKCNALCSLFIHLDLNCLWWIRICSMGLTLWSVQFAEISHAILPRLFFGFSE